MGYIILPVTFIHSALHVTLMVVVGLIPILISILNSFCAWTTSNLHIHH